MTMPNHDQRRLRPHAEVVAEYRREWPLYDAYRSIIEERNAHDAPITESQMPPGAIDNHTAAAIALRQLGRPDDRLAALMATEFFRKLEDEITALSMPVPPTVDGVLISYFLQYDDRLPTVKAWRSMDVDDQRFLIDELAEQVPGEVLPELLRIAMPSLLKHVIAEDERARRQRATTRDEHQGDKEPRDWVGLIGAAALDLPDTPDGHAAGRAHVDGLVADANAALTTNNRQF